MPAKLTSPSLERPASAQVAALVVMFLGGGLAGVGLSQLLAPDSFLAQFVGLFSFAVPFVIGMHLWLGLAVLTLLWRLLKARGNLRMMADSYPVQVPPGSIVFLPTCAFLVSIAGLIIAMLGSALGFFLTMVLYMTLGVVYGTVCWLLARSGYLPFLPE